MPKTPKVSVVCPTWNRATRVQNAIRSIIDQEYTDWEMIILDDGSTDNTREVVMSFANPAIKYHRVEHQGNISRIRNMANQLASGEILVVQDSDDMSLPDRLTEIVKCFDEHPEADVVYHGMYLSFIDPYNNAVIRKLRAAEPFDRERLKKEQYIPGQFAIRRKTWEEVHYNEEVVLMDDFAILLELAYSGKQFAPIFKNIYEYVGSPDSINVHGEMDGRRRQDVMSIIRILKEKYGADIHATLIKQAGDQILSKEEL